MVCFADFVFIHREAASIGPPVLEWIIGKILRKKIIYDFDDAIWGTDKVHENKLSKFFRWRKKTSSICKWSWKVSAGNSYLAEFASQTQTNVILNPTTIDTVFYQPIPKQEMPGQPLVIGWSGSFSTIKHFEIILPALEIIKEKYREQVFFSVIGDADYTYSPLAIQGRQWKLTEELSTLNTFNIGIMPLPRDEWANGKCGLKGLQYMALEIPTIMSPVGINKKIIKDGYNGFLAESVNEWVETLSLLIEDASLRGFIGKNGRKTVVESYSVISNSENFLSLFK
jgi:glycosyltransferase involved in cell wall biosynthesis